MTREQIKRRLARTFPEAAREMELLERMVDVAEEHARFHESRVLPLNTSLTYTGLEREGWDIPPEAA
jgi:hypothetical protein